MDQHPHIFLNFYMFTYLAALDFVLQIFIFFRNQDQITLLVIVHLQFVLPNYGTISPLTLRTVVLYLPLRQHWKLIFSQVLLLMTCSVFLCSIFDCFIFVFWHCIDFSCSFVLLFVAQWAAVWRILALYKFPYYYIIINTAAANYLKTTAYLLYLFEGKRRLFSPMIDVFVFFLSKTWLNLSFLVRKQIEVNSNSTLKTPSESFDSFEP